MTRGFKVNTTLLITFLARYFYESGLRRNRERDVEAWKIHGQSGRVQRLHTPGYMESEGKTADALWLTGGSFGWRGPWGATYVANLRMFVQSLKEHEWLLMAKNMKTRPPMPWLSLNKMKTDDLRAIYRYARCLDSGGESAPAYLSHGQEPAAPYALFPSPAP